MVIDQSGALSVVEVSKCPPRLHFGFAQWPKRLGDWYNSLWDHVRFGLGTRTRFCRGGFHQKSLKQNRFTNKPAPGAIANLADLIW